MKMVNVEDKDRKENSILGEKEFMTETIHLISAEAIKEKQSGHKKPTQSADALFNFMKEYEHLEDILRKTKE